MIILDVLTASFFVYAFIVCCMFWLDIEWMDAKDDMPFIVFSLSANNHQLLMGIYGIVYLMLLHKARNNNSKKQKMVHLNIK